MGVDDNKLADLAQRIRYCAQLVGSGDELARMTLIPRRTLEMYLSGRSEPKAMRLADIAGAARVSLDWLVLENGSPRPEASQDDGGGWADVPLYDVKVSTGYGALMDDEQIITHLKFRRRSLTKQGLHGSNLCAVQVVGDSMLPTLTEGDTLLIDRSQCNPVGDDVFVIRLGDALLAKRLQRMASGGIRIISDNPVYPPETIGTEDLQGLAILGRAVWFGRWVI